MSDIWLIDPPPPGASEEVWYDFVEEMIQDEVPEEEWEWMVPEDIFQSDKPDDAHS